MKRRLMAVLMALVMTLGLLPVSAFAADAEPTVKTGYYDADGSWVEGELHQTLPAGVTKVDKTAVKTGDNTYEVTLTVQLEQTTETTLPGAAATVLVIDTSGSMGYCAECGNEKEHNNRCKYYQQGFRVDNSVKAEQTRLTAAKTAAESFLKSYSGRYDENGTETAEQELNLGRYVALVRFSTGVSDETGWVDVSNASGYQTVLNAVKRLNASGGTNLDAGLRMADSLLAKKADIAASAKNVIALTDGEPTYYLSGNRGDKDTSVEIDGTTYYVRGKGSSCDENTFKTTKNTAAALKENATLYTVCFGAKNTTIRNYDEKGKNNTITVGDYLKTKIATSASTAYNADNADELNQAFAAITSSITTGLSSGLVKDSLPEGVSADERFASEWELKGVEGVKDGNKTIYTYTKTYTVTVDPETVTLDENGYTPLNGETTLTVGENETVDFPIPAVKAQITDEIVVTIKGNTDTAKYDGTSHSVTGYKVESITRNGVSYAGYTEKDFAFTGTASAEGTNADSYPMGLTANDFANINNRFANVTFVVEDGGLEITKRALTLTSATDSKEYDGTPLTNDTVTISGDGFADDEGASYNVTGSVTYVSEGEVENTFEVKLNDNTLAGNYVIETVEGKLTITQRSVTFTGESASKEWTGAEQEINGITQVGLLEGDTYEGLTYSARGTDAGKYDGKFTGDVTIKNADGKDVTANYDVDKTIGKLTITDKTEEVTVTFEIVNGTWENGSKDAKYATVTLTNGKGTLNADDVPTRMKADPGYTNGTWDVTPNTEENGIKGGEVYTYSYEKIIPASFNPTGYIVKEMIGDEMPNEETFTVNVASLTDGGAGVNGTATLRTGTADFVFPEGSSFSISEETIFMVAEDEGNAPRVTYDTEPRQLKVTVKLSDDEKSMVVDKVYYSIDGEVWHEIDNADKLVITNKYVDPTPASFNPNGYIVKQMEGTMPNEETFTVNVVPLVDGGAGVNGTATLRTGSTNFVFPESGSFAISEDTIFMVSEDEGSAARVTYDTTAYQLKVTVKLNADSTAMVVDKVYYSIDGKTWHEIGTAEQDDKLVITNSYVDPTPASFNPNGYIVKEMTGDEMPNEETFTVNVASLNDGADMNGTATLRTGTADFVFPEGSSFAISEDTIFMVSEDEGSAARVTYDTTAYQLKVTVKLSDDEKSMVVDKVYYSIDGKTWHEIGTTEQDDKLVITNSYVDPSSASFNPNGYIVKQMTGDEMPNEETFTVNVVPESGGAGVNGTATLRTGTADFVFPEGSSFSISGDTIFMVAEDEGNAPRVTYDTEPRQLKVTVKPSDDEKSMVVDKVYYSTDGKTWHEIGTADQDDKLVITNSYVDPSSASFNPNGYIVKQMTGDEMPNEETFTVNVAPLNGGADMNGTATLRTGSTNFVFPESGSFAISEDTIFMVSEDEGSAARVTYDTTAYQLKVTVKLNADSTAMVVDKVYYSTDGKTWHEIGTAEQDDKLVITNSYEAEIIPDAITIDLSQYIQKELKLTGDNRFTGATYTASVTPIIGGELGEAKTISVSYAANESGLKTFNGTLTFTESGTYRYEVKENIPANATGYDTSVYELLVVVTAEDGKLVATVGQKLAGDQSGEFTNEPIVFHNTYNTGNAIIIPPDERPTLNTDDHYAYVVGYPDGTVRPMGNITRAEVATIFFRLLTDDSRTQFWATTNAYSDVKSGDWFNNAVSTLSNAGIISGYPDGTFRPNAPITRAEMAKVIALFAKLDKSEDRFNDIAGHWAEAYIRLAAGNGWIAGYPDGSFKPQQNITRAETMTMINRVLDRVPSVESHLLPYNVMLTFPDCQSGQWYYIAVQEATNSHTYERAVTEKNGDEKWIALRENRDWTEFEY